MDGDGEGRGIGEGEFSRGEQVRDKVKVPQQGSHPYALQLPLYFLRVFSSLLYSSYIVHTPFPQRSLSLLSTFLHV